MRAFLQKQPKPLQHITCYILLLLLFSHKAFAPNTESEEQAKQTAIQVVDRTIQYAHAQHEQKTLLRQAVLNNEDLLPLVFQFLDVKDLRACREVCKLWAAEALPFLLTHPNVTLSPGFCDNGSLAPDRFHHTFCRKIKNLRTCNRVSFIQQPLNIAFNSFTSGVLDVLRPQKIWVETFNLTTVLLDQPFEALCESAHEDANVTEEPKAQAHSAETHQLAPISVDDEAFYLWPGAFDCLVSLAIEGEDIPYGVLNALAQNAPNLRHLSLAHSTLEKRRYIANPVGSEPEFVCLQDLRQLTSLNVATLVGGDDELYELVDQDGNPVSETEFMCLQDLTQLTSLNVATLVGGDDELYELVAQDGNPFAALTNLNCLNLEDTMLMASHVGNLGLENMQLQKLNLKGTCANQSEHATLQQLEHLEELTPSHLSLLFNDEDADLQNIACVGPPPYEPGENFDTTPLCLNPPLKVLKLNRMRLTNPLLERLLGVQTLEELHIQKSYLRSYYNEDELTNDMPRYAERAHVLLGEFENLKKLFAKGSRHLRRFPLFINPGLVTHLDLENCRLATLEGLKSCCNLEYLNLSRNKDVQTPEIWLHLLHKVKRLKTLNMEQNKNIPYTEEEQVVCAEVLAQNQNLETLDLTCHQIGLWGAAGLQHLHWLRELNIRQCGLGDEGFQHVPLLQLQSLNASYNNLTGASLAFLKNTLQNARAHNLKTLLLNGNAALRGADIAHLVPLNHVRTLFICDMPLGNEAMHHLQALFNHVRDMHPFGIGIEGDLLINLVKEARSKGCNLNI